ncbi:MAG: tRNA pseudouridine(55) synthase TruB [Lachnospiraceae bacterium]|nr:tRNA pseudouridine(55) synthase TruB [Lachnospiraceae bacterium]
MIHGVMIVNKEKDFTSHDVVAKLRGICKQKKIGHTGTLDPNATGVLPVCLGNATKLCDLLTDHDKAYEAVLLLGVKTDTQDMTGTVLEEKEVTCSEDEIRKAIASFVGDSMQVPPMYSALKVNGQKLYELARKGIEVERKARSIHIDAIDILAIDGPRITIRVSCSKGTYIRTLCEDIGEALGCGGCMEELKRIRVGVFTIDKAKTLDEIEALRDAGRLSEIVMKVDDIYADAPALTVVPEAVGKLENGNIVFFDEVRSVPAGDEGFVRSKQERMTETKTTGSDAFSPGQLYRMYHANGAFYGLYTCEEDRLKPYKMFLPEKI